MREVTSIAKGMDISNHWYPDNKSLKLSDLGMGSREIFNGLMPFIVQHRDIKLLDLANNYISSDGITLLCNFLVEKEIHLEYLDISGSALDYNSVTALGSYVYSNQSLQHLKLHGCLLNNKNICALMHYLNDHASLETLDIQDNLVNMSGLVFVMVTLHSCHCMTDLYILRNNLSYMDTLSKCPEFFKLEYITHGLR